ncbi:MAG: 4-(cytidine 5'-diphospho)-2-C-methyl-D-erythritol kinase [Pseudomonadota bacterium]
MKTGKPIIGAFYGAFPAPWPAPAKLNLMLKILGRRADGYHTLQSVFQFLDWGDEIFLRPRNDGTIHRLSELPGVPPEQDLVVRAARLLKNRSGCRWGVDIAVHKRLPLGGGLGGGSSDAATVLVALNQLWSLGMSREELAALGLTLGADVPVFIHGRAAWAEGIGEQLTFFNPETPWYLVVVPPCPVSTAAVFQHPELTRDAAPTTIAGFLSGVRDNDCWRVVSRLYPPVSEAHAWLSQFAATSLTGTGGCVFAAFAEEARARMLLRDIPRFFGGVVARGRNRSPLMDRLID